MASFRAFLFTSRCLIREKKGQSADKELVAREHTCIRTNDSEPRYLLPGQFPYFSSVLRIEGAGDGGPIVHLPDLYCMMKWRGRDVLRCTCMQCRTVYIFDVSIEAGEL